MGVATNAIYRCDSLALMERMDDGTVALAYLDPPWLLNQVVTRHKDGPSEEEIEAFLEAHFDFMVKVYQQIHRTLTNEGVVVLHSDRQLQGHTRLILDQVFGRRNFRHEFVIPQRRIGNPRPGLSHETLLMYSKSNDFFFTPPTRRLTTEEIAASHPGADEQGRYRLIDLTAPGGRPNGAFEWQGVLPPEGRSWRYSRQRMTELAREGRIVVAAARNIPRLKDYLDDAAEVEVGDVWDDLPAMPARKERTGWAAQRPAALLDRVVAMASREGDVVLDPFCGSGTTLACAQALGRRWVGCDIAEDAIAIANERMERTFGLTANVDFTADEQTDLEQRWPVVYSVYPVINTGINPPRALDFVLDQPLPIEETRHYEFKEIKGQNPAGSIQAVADQYAVAFLNCEGGRIFWGVRDEDRTVIGVQLDHRQRDEVRRVVTEKLGAIEPPITPTSWKLEIHPVRDADGCFTDRYVVELTVPRVSSKQLFFAKGTEAWVKTDGGKKQLAGLALVEEIKKRHGL